MSERSRRLWFVPLTALLVLVAGCEGEPRAKKRTNVTVKPREVIGKTTQDIRDAKTELKEEGAQVASPKIVAKDPITLQGNAYVTMIGRTSILQIEAAMKLFQAANDRYPANYDEFKKEIIDANNISLPTLPAYQEYFYDEKEHKLQVREYPDRKAQAHPGAR